MRKESAASTSSRSAVSYKMPAMDLLSTEKSLTKTSMQQSALSRIRRMAASVSYTRLMRFLRAAILTALLASPGLAQFTTSFAPLDQWQMAILRGDNAELSSLYSVSPPAEVKTGTGEADLNAEYAFWKGLKPA